VIYSVVYFVPVIRYSSFIICCAFIRQLSLVIICSFILFVVRLFILFHYQLNFVLLFKKETKNNSDPELCSGISILQLLQVPVDCYLFNTII
jgi:hypothetical protein